MCVCVTECGYLSSMLFLSCSRRWIIHTQVLVFLSCSRRRIIHTQVVVDLKSLVFSLSGSFKPMEVVAVPRARGGLAYGYGVRERERASERESLAEETPPSRAAASRVGRGRENESKLNGLTHRH